MTDEKPKPVKIDFSRLGVSVDELRRGAERMQEVFAGLVWVPTQGDDAAKERCCLDASERALLNEVADLLYLPDDERAKRWPNAWVLNRYRTRIRGLADPCKHEREGE